MHLPAKDYYGMDFVVKMWILYIRNFQKTKQNMGSTYIDGS